MHYPFLRHPCFGLPQVSTIIIPTSAYRAALTRISASRVTRPEYMVVIDQKEKAMEPVKRAPNRAPVFRPSVIALALLHCRKRVRNNAVTRFDTIIAHQTIPPSGLFKQVFVPDEKKSIRSIP